MNLLKAKLIYNPPGLISQDESWCISACGYLYGPCDSELEVLIQMMAEWKDEKHLVG